MTTTALVAGASLYVPPGAVAVVLEPCRPRPDWVPYTVQPGDGLFRLSLTFGVTQSELQAANCLSSVRINAGQVLYVPPTASLAPPTAVSPAPVPEPMLPLVVEYPIALEIRRDPAVLDGGIVVIFVPLSGGAEPYRFYDEGQLQPGNPYELLATCGGNIVHTVRVEPGDGQSTSLPYYLPVECPP